MTENQRRKFLKLVGASLAGAAGMSILGCEKSEVKSSSPTRKELVKRLKALAESESPKDLSPGACCYFPLEPNIKKKPCPKCGQTMIVGEKDEVLLAYNVPLKRIQDLGLDATLILPEHCPTCGLGLNEKKFHLEIKYSDDPDFVRVELDRSFDLQLMALFLQGKDRYAEHRSEKGLFGSENALKDKVGRLRELFGVKE